MKVLNCTQHTLSKEQLNELREVYGIEDFANLSEVYPELFKKLANMNGDEDLIDLATKFLNETEDTDFYVLPIGTPAFMFALGRISMEFGEDRWIQSPFLFSFSERIVSEVKNEDGSVSKTSIFKHKKFLQV